MAKKRKFGKYDGKKYEWIKLFKLVIVAAVAVLLLLALVIGTSRVDGRSMEPTLDDSQLVAYLRIGNSYDRGDVVAIKMPSGDRYVKRVIAAEGDTVDIEGGKVIVNGETLDEAYIKGTTEPDGNTPDTIVSFPYTVEKGKVFVLGDNREHSTDSRVFGPVVLEMIKGRLLFVK